MLGEIRSVVRLSVPTDSTKNVKRLMGDLIESCQNNDSTCLGYEWFFNEKETELIVLECYKTSEAVLAHVGNIGEALVKEFNEAAKVNRLEVFGEVSSEVVEAVSTYFPATEYYRYWGGFSRK